MWSDSNTLILPLVYSDDFIQKKNRGFKIEPFSSQDDTLLRSLTWAVSFLHHLEVLYIRVALQVDVEVAAISN